MGLNAGKILKISITTDSKEEVLEYVQKYLFSPSKSRPKPFVIVTPNPEQVVLAQTNSRFQEILNWADIAIPDGIGMSFAGALLGVAPRISRIPGIEFMDDLMGLSGKQPVRIGLIGGREGLAVKSLECLQARYSGLSGWANEGGVLPMNSGGIVIPQSLVSDIADTVEREKTNMVFVGMGAPKQEYLIRSISDELVKRKHNSPLVLMSVGGSFDIISGRLRRAPLFARSIGFEWFWRLAQEPWRLRRQLALIKFIQLVCVEYWKIRSRGGVSRSQI